MPQQYPPDHTKAGIDAAISELVIANRILAREDVIDDFGHVSLRHPFDPGRYFLSRSRSPANVTRDDILEFDLDGNLLGNDHRSPYRERAIHGEIYRARPDVNAVTHHHARSVLPFTMTQEPPLKPVFHMGSVIGTRIDTWDSQDEFGDTNMLVETAEQGASLARVLGRNRVALLRAHGAVCAMPTLRQVCMVSIYLKENAELFLNALQITRPGYISEGEARLASETLLNDLCVDRAWDYWTARAGFAGL
ncbi:class II aldolase/adducin family protein [Sedimentitalea todarodis]|uniref:Class II aldolase/adducin family protein n=1 Tax=Sedimentitalea todarodis TaxID=1631240 RepID=A0ABU3VHI2_9RHOB|nr:class II aldolase/adducin family protein [Sedimentitalea todarodis]MDU9005621.1 class II aldolase/adducin family protein [Sedimentitalea todarodis]